MAGYQAFCAIGSACALQVFRTGLRPSVNAKLIWILAGSMFFMQITANAWPKFLAAAFILASWQTLGTERRGRFVLAGVMLGFGLAMHQSGVLFIPILMVRCWSGRLEWSRFILAAALMLGIAGLLIVPWELHTILRYGWESKIHANPAVGQRLENIPMWLNALLVGVTTLLAWGPVDIAIHWASAANPFAPSRISKDLYWMATSICNSGAGSLLGLMLPWWVALGTREMARKISAFGHSVDVKVAAAFAFALAGQMLLNPFYSADGSLQTGFVPVGLALTIWFANELSEMDAQKTTAVLRKIVWLSAGPWLVFNLMLTAGLVTSGRMRSGFLDSDLQLLDTRAMVSLGMGCFPWLQCSLALTVYLLVRQPRPR